VRHWSIYISIAALRRDAGGRQKSGPLSFGTGTNREKVFPARPVAGLLEVTSSTQSVKSGRCLPQSYV
jgi:hypothetical protein